MQAAVNTRVNADAPQHIKDREERHLSRREQNINDTENELMTASSSAASSDADAVANVDAVNAAQWRLDGLMAAGDTYDISLFR